MDETQLRVLLDYDDSHLPRLEPAALTRDARRQQRRRRGVVAALLVVATGVAGAVVLAQPAGDSLVVADRPGPRPSAAPLELQAASDTGAGRACNQRLVQQGAITAGRGELTPLSNGYGGWLVHAVDRDAPSVQWVCEVERVDAGGRPRVRGQFSGVREVRRVPEASGRMTAERDGDRPLMCRFVEGALAERRYAADRPDAVVQRRVDEALARAVALASGSDQPGLKALAPQLREGSAELLGFYADCDARELVYNPFLLPASSLAEPSAQAACPPASAEAGGAACPRDPSVGDVGTATYLPDGWEQYAEEEVHVPTEDGRQLQSLQRRYRDSDAPRLGFVVVDVNHGEVFPVEGIKGRADRTVRPGTVVDVYRESGSPGISYSWQVSDTVQVSVRFHHTGLTRQEQDRLVAGVR